MKPYYDEYGKNVIYWYDNNTNIVMLLGKYSHQEIMNSSSDTIQEIKKNHITYLGIKKYNYVYLVYQGIKPMLRITTALDGWTGNKSNSLYVYHLKPDILFMNWKENPLEVGK